MSGSNSSAQPVCDFQKMSVDNMAFLMDRLYLDCSPLQFLRELTRNSIESIERTADGGEQSWADVIAWDPPHRFVVAWHPDPEPEAASILEVRFTADTDGTRIDLEHRGWEEFGSEGPAIRAGYDTGWDAVLEPFEAAAG